MSNKRKSDLSKLLFIASGLLLLGWLAIGLGMYSATEKTTLYRFANKVVSDIKLVHDEVENLKPGGVPIHFLQPSRTPGSGVTVNKRPDDGNLVMLASYFDDGLQLRLIRRDGSVVARWPLSFSKHFKDTSHLKRPPTTDRNVDLQGALLRPNGSLVFNYGHAGTVKLDRCGAVIWTLAYQTHHSIESAEAGGYWILGRRVHSGAIPEAFPPFTRMQPKQGYPEDLILKVTEDGTIARQMSIPRILYDNGLEPLMTANGFSFLPDGQWEPELVHANKIAELPCAFAGAFQGFDPGDLVISLRNYNLLFVVDPDDWRIKWHQTGPWKRQHDPEFNADGTISVFNNNIYRLDLGENDRAKPDTPRVSNIMKVDPATGRTRIVFGGREGQEFLSVIRGKHDPTPEGGFLVTEYEGGRAFEFDARGDIVWEYVNRYDADRVLQITEARLYPNAYFTVDDWSCPTRTVLR